MYELNTEKFGKTYIRKGYEEYIEVLIEVSKKEGLSYPVASIDTAKAFYAAVKVFSIYAGIANKDKEIDLFIRSSEYILENSRKNEVAETVIMLEFIKFLKDPMYNIISTDKDYVYYLILFFRGGIKFILHSLKTINRMNSSLIKLFLIDLKQETSEFFENTII